MALLPTRRKDGRTWHWMPCLAKQGRAVTGRQGWVTEVISPVLSQQSWLWNSHPWLFSPCTKERFVDLNQWVEERAWIVLRLPSGRWDVRRAPDGQCLI